MNFSFRIKNLLQALKETGTLIGASLLLVIGCVSSLQAEVARQNPTKDTFLAIDKTVDSAYLYAYEKTKFVPPVGKTLLIMGQTVERIKEYQRNFPNETNPAGWAAYFGISDLKGITEPLTVNDNNTQHHQMLVDKFPNSVIQSAMWMVGKWDVAKNVKKGAYDKVIKRYSKWAKSAKRPIYLRIGYEFDGPHNALDPSEYKEAYQHIVDLFRAEGADNIAFVWHSYAAEPYKNFPVSDWYPGDDYVDWVGISVFGHAYNSGDFGIHCENVLNFAKQHKKPVMIAESNPIHGIVEANANVWNEWFVNYFSFIYRKNIKAISFINEDWPSTGIEGIPDWKDSKLYTNQEVSKAWFSETNNDRYLKQSPLLYEQLGYSASDLPKPKLQSTETSDEIYQIPKVDLPFYVYKDGDEIPYIPSGLMGNYKALSLDLKNTQDIQNGTNSLKLQYDASSDWYGVAFVNPPNDWGDLPGGYDVSGAKTFSFWAKCTQDERKVNIGFGLIKGDKPFPDSAIKMKELNLSTKWEKYTFKLRKEDLSCIRSGFVIFSTGFKTGHEIFLDDIVFE